MRWAKELPSGYIEFRGICRCEYCAAAQMKEEISDIDDEANNYIECEKKVCGKKVLLTSSLFVFM